MRIVKEYTTGRSPREWNHCSVVTLSAVTGIPEEKSAEFLELLCGRWKREGVQLSEWLDLLRTNYLEITELYHNWTVPDLLRALPTDKKFIVNVPAHTFAVVLGQVSDINPKHSRNQTVITIFDCTQMKVKG